VTAYQSSNTNKFRAVTRRQKKANEADASSLPESLPYDPLRTEFRTGKERRGRRKGARSNGVQRGMMK